MAQWLDPNKRPLRASRMGAFLQWGQEQGRLSPELFSLAEAIDCFNSTTGQPPESRVAAWGPVEADLKAITGQQVTADAYLRTLSIYQAGSFALDVRETEAGPDFVPILMGRDRAPTLEDDAPLDEASGEVPAELPDAEAVSLLTPDLRDRFVEQAWPRSAHTRAAYVLERNTFLVLVPGLRTALDVVREKRRADPEERRAFIRNPRPAIAEALGSEDAEDLSHLLFVETKQYSERVLGLKVWEAPQFPWLTRKSEQWLPESFSAKIGGSEIELSSEEIEELRDEVEHARECGLSDVELKGQRYPIEDIERIFASLPEAEDLSSEVHSSKDDEEPGSPATRSVLDLKENFDTIDFSAALQKRLVLESRAFPDDLCPVSRPKEHQLRGFEWLVEAWESGLPGALLADDMGLGKTFQALAFLAWFRENRQAARLRRARLNNGPILIVAPTALLRNWVAEAERHLSPGALGEKVEAFGPGLRRLKRPAEGDGASKSRLDHELLTEADWVLTTYETLADNHLSFARVPYSIGVFDEMQKVKSPGTINTHAAKAMNVDFVIGLTGTPIENRLEDLWCIMDRIFPGYLGPLRQFSEMHGEGDGEALQALKARMDQPKPPAPAIMLRRMKEDILDGLPEKTIECRSVEMPERQAEAYERAVAEAKTGPTTRGAMLKALHAFRGISLHPAGADDVDPYEPESVKEWIAGSARLAHAVGVLRKIQEKNEKALVFLEDRAVQTAFAAAATVLFDLPSEPAVINGATPGDRRQAVVDRFQKQPPGFHLLVLSPKAAGVGLTITAANHVVHLSRWWNPAVEEQCNDRVYRIGQELPVTVHIPMAVHPDFGEASFDLTLDRLLQRKRDLSRNMLAPPVAEGDVDALFGATLGAETAPSRQ
ncbi:DEAD/DEAH box helicase [Afifella sp. IM 167]|uniref:DEAD/DEAH box helicase n=1 Tax=Afifella sp. IM 167 TaxID=2033586 RepID=UPI001CCDD2CC